MAGERAQTIDELPLDWFFGPGVVLDMTGKADGEAVEVADVEDELRRSGHELQARDIVLVRTGRDAHIREPGYMALGPGVTARRPVAVGTWGARDGIDAWAGTRHCTPAG